MKKLFYKITIFLIIVLLGSTNLAFAGTANLSWNANTEPDLAGYKIYYGTSPRTGSCPAGGYSTNINVGNVTNYALSGLTDGQTYYFSITAIDTSNNESCFSSEVSKIIPATTPTPTPVSNVKFTPIIEGITNISGRDFTITILNAGTTTQIAQWTTQPDITNNLIIPTTVTINSGTYDILLYSSLYLKKKKTSVVLSSNSTISLTTLPAGDLNSDNFVNSLDWSLMNPYWFTNNATADINKDSLVNTIDFSLLNKNWAQSGDN